ncbi:hypothetical protein VPLG_00043 [Vibrio phage eugene 12A10]|uniref:hypothetical protein n=1 Tax=Vibrio phage eugene 12A10 TaxID=573172 RepID=UPI0003514E98|nr:hypothetical protein VPLG_00043 [Vibrio phage eugene 12A10]AGN51482.1 hypothetical protein VPLG_00043 [Vibrio phage eugene 12A10]
MKTCKCCEKVTEYVPTEFCLECETRFQLDLTQRDLENAKKFIQSLIGVSNELNYRLRKTDQPEGFYHHIELAENFLKEVK